MDDALASGSPALPSAALYPATAILALMIAVVIFKTRSTAAKFVIFACWFRYMFAAFHQFSFSGSPVGISYNALASILICLLGFAVLDLRRIFTVFYVPIGLMVLLITLSGLVNAQYGGISSTVAKFGYLTVVCAGVAEAIRDLGENRFLKLLLWSFVTPFLLQFLSVVFGIAKASEADGSASYIGGYYHEAVFSITLATCLLVTVMVERISRPLKVFLVAISIAGIVLANYRTTILAMAPLILVQVATGVPRQFRRKQRAIIFVAIGVVLVIASAASILLERERFDDLAYVWNNAAHLIKPLQDFSADDKRVLSGRIYLWSEYVYGYIGGNDIQHIIGFGPDHWENSFSMYAHNTLISYLYEYGILGVCAILFLWGWMLRLAFRARGAHRGKLISAHLSFFILNMATMPHWQIEGNILYGILCGYTIAKVARRPTRVAVQRPGKEHDHVPIYGAPTSRA